MRAVEADPPIPPLHHELREGEKVTEKNYRAGSRGGLGRRGDLHARGTEEGMEPDDLLCSRNARPQKGWRGSGQVPFLLAEPPR